MTITVSIEKRECVTVLCPYFFKMYFDINGKTLPMRLWGWSISGKMESTEAAAAVGAGIPAAAHTKYEKT